MPIVPTLTVVDVRPSGYGRSSHGSLPIGPEAHRQSTRSNLPKRALGSAHALLPAGIASFGAPALELALKQVGTDHLVMGSD